MVLIALIQPGCKKKSEKAATGKIRPEPYSSSYVNSRIDHGDTPLHLVAQNGKVETVKLLIEKGADINAANNDGATPLDLANKASNIKVARFLQSKIAGLENLLAAVKSGDAEKVKTILSANPKLADMADEKGRNSLHYAINTAMAQLLISNGADVNRQDDDGRTPLHIAASNGNKEMVALLIAKGAKVEIRQKQFGHTPLETAISEGRTEIVRFLLANGANANKKGLQDWSPLHLAAWKGYEEIVEILIANGAEVNKKDQEGRTPMRYAAQEGHLKTVETLRRHGGIE